MAEPISDADKHWQEWGGVLGSLQRIELAPSQTALVVVDMQYSDAHRDYGIGAKAKRLGTEAQFAYYFDRLDSLVVPNIARMQEFCRATGHRSDLPAHRLAAARRTRDATRCKSAAARWWRPSGRRRPRSSKRSLRSMTSW
jgi:hypothetical protein